MLSGIYANGTDYLYGCRVLVEQHFEKLEYLKLVDLISQKRKHAHQLSDVPGPIEEAGVYCLVFPLDLATEVHTQHLTLPIVVGTLHQRQILVGNHVVLLLLVPKYRAIQQLRGEGCWTLIPLYQQSLHMEAYVELK